MADFPGMRRRFHGTSLLGRFSLLSLLLVAALGFGLAQLLRHQIHDRALANAEGAARLVAEVGIQSHLSPADLIRAPTRRRLDELDSVLASEQLPAAGVERVKVYDRELTLVYSDNRELIGQSASGSEGVEKALQGELVSELEADLDHTGEGGESAESSSEGENFLEVYVPLRFGDEGRPDGVFELYQSYAPVADSARRDTLSMYVALGIGLALFWAVLFRIVYGASRTLRRQAAENRHQALHDSLTGLPNRDQLYQHIARSVSTNDGRELSAAILLIDLDMFKEVNDTLGHDYGDRVLQEVARRLKSGIRDRDVLARLGGDEFAILVRDLPHRGAVMELASRIRHALEEPFEIGGFAVRLEASVGAAICPADGRDPNTLLQRADVAMYEAKRTRSRIQTYSAEHDPYSPRRLALLGELPRAIKSGELVLHYQPKVDLATREVCGVEALVRWQHPERGLLPPGEFIPLAERTASIGPLTLHVINAALEQCSVWRDADIDIKVAVNIAGANLVDLRMPEAVSGLLARWKVPPSRLELEISEETTMIDPGRALEVLSRFHSMGLRLSLDDFGTGQTSLAYLRRLPLEQLKVDRSFIARMANDEDDIVVVRSIVNLAHNLGLEVVAEGVESEQVLSELVAMRCDVAQGFLLGRPVPATELTARLASELSEVA
jgi:diguanylate cyclase (GGDEF)-like protein